MDVTNSVQSRTLEEKSNEESTNTGAGKLLLILVVLVVVAILLVVIVLVAIAIVVEIARDHVPQSDPRQSDRAEQKRRELSSQDSTLMRVRERET